MKCFILVNKTIEDYSSIPAQYERVFIFDHVKTSIETPQFHMEQLFKILDEADAAEDMIIFNGPSWLIALAGYVWYTVENRSCLNTFIYSSLDQSYKALQGTIDYAN